MENSSTTFTLEIDFTNGKCPIGEKIGNRHIAEDRTPILSCEGACIRGEIARLAANMVAKEGNYLRACHGELFSVPQSAMAQWVKQSGKVVLIDGCFLKCHGRILKNLVGEEAIVHFDALSMYNKYTNIFEIDDVPESERIEVAREIADTVLAALSMDSEIIESDLTT